MKGEVKLEDLEGIGPKTAEKLRSIGICSAKHLSLFNVDELLNLVDVDERTLRRALAHARSIFMPLRAIKALDNLAQKSLPQLTTGVKSIDLLLNGGLRPRAIYELCGQPGAGKTQLCLQLSVTIQLSANKGGIGGKCYFMDTEGTFSLSRVKVIAERFGLDSEYALSNIYVIDVINTDHLLQVITSDLVRAVEDGVKLVIVDSLMSRFRTEYAGRESLALRQSRLGYALDWLVRIARLYEVIVIVTTPVMEVPVAFVSINERLRPVGGTTLAHATTHRFFLTTRSERGVLRGTMTVLDSPSLPHGAIASYLITDKGIEDA
ncbi:MAG: DNA repair and recombination protein RadA [Candidatus Nezhaarchaeales archaeon]|nr:MAG: DNA repair and recombination protein RadA [Candidatus Nezhaarchaeota archaeon WYZ-LMO8]TDA36843.1 MAG: DNA repair and recombination protein RadA [Candidatus Nezhaarchaeota archaeon WYZ-LMO7]